MNLVGEGVIAATDPARDTAPRRRAVVLVGSPANPYSRAIRIGRTLVGMGYDVEIAATHQDGVSDEVQDGDLRIRRYPPIGWWASRAARYDGVTGPRTTSRWRVVRVAKAVRNRLIEWLFWPQTVRGWWAALGASLPPADLYHSCGLLPLPAALAARARDRRAGRRSRVVYDVIDVTSASNQARRLPGPARALLALRERRWARAADAWCAVNAPFAARARASWGLPAAPAVVPNYPEPRAPGPGAPDPLRAAAGLAPGTPVCLFWGRLGPDLGLDEAAEAVLLVPGAVLVLLGFGRGYAASRARDADPRYAGRHVTLPAVHPDELLAWVAPADCAMVALPPVSYNQRHTTPNKFLEAVAAGVPVVLGPGLPTMEGLLRADGLGEVAASMDPADVAAAVNRVLAAGPALRGRVRAAAPRYAWPAAAAEYRALVRGLGAG